MFKKKILKTVPRNPKGELGAICDDCGGYGFTNFLAKKPRGGYSEDCPACMGLGIREAVNV